jgi:trans-aconitate 2-methyltransferase
VRNRDTPSVLDLGCGTGALTAELHRALHARSTLGIDSSLAMLERAARVSAPGLRFELADIATLSSRERYDVVFSNAALQWLPDHDALLARLARLLQPHGELAVQVPANFDHPSHTVATQVAREPEFAEALGSWVRVSPVLQPERYAELLHELGLVAVHVRLQVYGHELDGASEVVEWTMGSLLTDYQARMPEALFERFVQRYRRRVMSVLGDHRPYFYAFKRILMRAARRPMSR